MPIRTKFLIVFFTTSLLPLIFLAYINFDSSRKALIKETQAKLTTVETLQISRINLVVNTYQGQADVIVTRPLMLQMLNDFNKTHDKTLQDKLNNFLKDLQQVSQGVETISVRDTKGEIIASTDKSLIGNKKPGILPGLDYLPTKDNKFQMLFRKPIFMQTIPLGEVEIIVKSEVLAAVIQDYTGLGSTGEFIIGKRAEDGKIIYITPRRFEKLSKNQGFLMNEALSKHKGFFSGVTDYRGKSVAAVTSYMPDLAWGVVVKTDMDEAFQSVNALQDTIIIFSFIFILVIIMVTLFFVHSITAPVLSLVSVAKQVRAGDLSKRAMVLSKDEVGELSISFNAMVDALQESHVDLEKKVVERTAQLETSNKALEAFSYSVSHDLRAPLRSIDGFSKILGEDYAGKLDDEGKHVVATIRTSTQQMATLIDDLLAFSRLGRQEVKATEVNMTALAKTVFAELKLVNPERSIQFTCTELPIAHVDPSLIRQVWTNLLSNAIKFTRKKPAAAISIGSKVSDNEIIYFVRDNGAGFDMKYINKLFVVFQRLHSAQDFEGTGIGLSLVQRIINKHGGKIWAEGVVDQGATFYFSLPKTA